MEETSSFISINKNKKEKRYVNKNKTNQLITINIQKLVIIILILLILILCLVIGIILLKNSDTYSIETINNNNIKNISLNKKDDIQEQFKRDIFNNIENFKPGNRLFQKQYDPIPEGKNQIHIAMAIDNNFVYPTLVSMASGLYNNNKEKNIIVYHLLFSHDFKSDKYEIFESLKKRYEFSLNYYIIPDLFKSYRKWVYQI